MPKKPVIPKKGRPFKYPWETWLVRATPKVLKQSEHSQAQNTMCVQLRTHAKRLGVRARVIPLSNGSIRITPLGLLKKAPDPLTPTQKNKLRKLEQRGRRRA